MMRQDDCIRLIIFDLNGTLIRENSWLALNLAMGMNREEDAALLRKHRAGEITYTEGQKRLERYYLSRGNAEKKRIGEVLYSYTFFPQVPETVQYLKSRGYDLAVISGSVDLLVRHVSRRLGIRRYAANNRFRFDAGGRLQRIETDGDDVQFKAARLDHYCRDMHIPVSRAAAVGDGENDRQLFRKTGHGITFTGSPLTADAWRIIGSFAELWNTF